MRTLYLPLLLGLSLSHAALAAMYKWTDSEGNTVFSQTRPPDGREARTVAPPPPPAESPAEAQKRLHEMQQKLDDAREDRHLQAQQEQKALEEQHARQENCRKAKRNLQILEQRSRQLINAGDGQYRRYTPEEKAQKAAEYEAVIRRDCE